MVTRKHLSYDPSLVDSRDYPLSWSYRQAMEVLRVRFVLNRFSTSFARPENESVTRAFLRSYGRRISHPGRTVYQTFEETVCIHALTCIWSDIRRGSVRNRLRILRGYGEMSIFDVNVLVA